ncbi:DEAD/DEAH box helicase [Galbitalea sp. SE-J8]|uniref:Lhr family ATP-dependent helicase n=1 Tax=Galbitalea sp. SE-J8 TaxID=3054952 RepID=UPI00259CB3B8|nr:DEAD/DEAH box helicase [Galbitalea sp. SE-J8]MDM4761574.1 DEAD/DEAH box helicase [Galbitalea sp. SE-J8]
MTDVLDRFSAVTRAWFEGAFAAPTPAQAGAWDAISTGSHALVVAPTGSGKTLASFLWSIDRLASEPAPDAATSTRVLYISPLKALGVDVERNLRTPLVGIQQAARRLGVESPSITVGVRSGDTPTDERRRLLRTPPDILITTPESLYLMLTSQARETLRGVETVIVDEVHAVAATKRGAHLAVSLERLDELLDRPAQRIGLSATVRPTDEVARFLGGRAPVAIVNPPASKTFDLSVAVPVEDMTALGEQPVAEGSASANPPQSSIWPHVEEEIVDLIESHRSTIVFANSRRLAERLTGRLNEIANERRAAADSPVEEPASAPPLVEEPASAASRRLETTTDPSANEWSRDASSLRSGAPRPAETGRAEGVADGVAEEPANGASPPPLVEAPLVEAPLVEEPASAPPLVEEPASAASRRLETTTDPSANEWSRDASSLRSGAPRPAETSRAEGVADGVAEEPANGASPPPLVEAPLVEAPLVEAPLVEEPASAASRRLETTTDRSADAWSRDATSLRSVAPRPAAVGAPRPAGAGGMPAQLMAQSGVLRGAPPLLARAHHGSVSKEQRAIIEDDLKRGALRCVVATSSLELGIDMGAVDLVIQVGAPPSVASGLQRIGRAGHQVGEISEGVVFPSHRADLLHATVATERMLAGAIEAIAIPQNPLDVLAQQTVAALALDTLNADNWYDTVRRSAPFATLPRSAFDATLDLLSGLYPSDEFAELRPRIVYDRVSGELSGRPGAQRLAVTSGGTIPDRGLFGVYLVGAESTARGGGRVGELDEEMVYESRVGDVFALGTTSWRIEDITHDRVLVSPAYGVPARAPFWKGDGIGRPAELGEAIGRFSAEVASSLPTPPVQERRRPLVEESASAASRRLETTTDPSADERSRDATSLPTPPVQERYRPLVEESASAASRRLETSTDPSADERSRDATSLRSGAPRPAGSGAPRPAGAVEERLAAAGLDARARGNLLAFFAEQKAATGAVPTDTTLVVERFHDELGDWRVILHSPYGMPVHAPWALAVGARIRERLGVDGAAMASDDGIVVRVPDTDGEAPGAELFLFDADELRDLVTDEVGGSALFASRFRENAARALLLPRRDPGKRSPLWQQRQRASQLLDVARRYPSFPIVLETVREVLQDVYDLPALLAVTGRIASRDIRLIESDTDIPSPYARSMLFGYVAAFMYEGDSPLAERRAAALSLDPTLLAELLGRAELRELLDPAVIARTEAELQRLAPDRRVRADAEGVADLLRVLGPLTAADIGERLQPASGAADPPVEEPAKETGPSPLVEEPAKETGPSPLVEEPASEASRRLETTTDRSANERSRDATSLRSGAPRPAETARAEGLADELARAGRAIRVTLAGEPRFAAIEDAARLRDALGAALPIGIPTAFLEPVPDPLGDLVARFARTHGPFDAADVATRYGLGIAVVTDALRRLGADRRVVDGEFRADATGTEWCDAEVLRRLRTRSLAALRREVEPVDGRAFARFLAAWQHVGVGDTRREPVRPPLTGVDGVAQVIDQLAGVPLPASAWETLVLPARVRDYAPTMLDELTLAGEVLWTGAGALPGSDGWVGLHLADSAPTTLPAGGGVELDDLRHAILEALAGGGAFFFRQLAAAVGTDATQDGELTAALWALVWSGLVTNDTLAPLRAFLGGPTSRPRARSYRGRARGLELGASRNDAATPAPRGLAPRGPRYRAASSSPPLVSGRWSLVPTGGSDVTIRAKAAAEQLLERYGVVTRGSVAAEGVPGGFATTYRVLGQLEETGRARRGYIVEGLGAAQFSTGATIDRVRSFVVDPDAAPALAAVTLAAVDPANPYGAALDWPVRDSESKHRPGRKAGALVILVDGALAVYVEKGGKTVLTFTDDEAVLAAASASLAATVRRSLGRARIDTVDGEFAAGTAFGKALVEAGFGVFPQGLRLRA